jgi:hypothetical protein
LVSDDHLTFDHWVFDDPPDLGVFVTEDVRSGSPVVLVSHDDDGDWAFSGGMDWEVENMSLVHLGWVIAQDPRLAELASLPRGYGARRESSSHPWERFADPFEDDVETNWRHASPPCRPSSGVSQWPPRGKA